MALTCFTDPDAVRKTGSIKDDSASGSATERQLQAAIDLASTRMKQIVAETTYDEVLAYTSVELSSDGAKKKKRLAFENAESLLALAYLPAVVQNAQLTETGVQQSIKTGQAEKRFASLEESKGIGEVWEREALDVLAPFLTALITDADTGETTGFRSRRRFFVTHI